MVRMREGGMRCKDVANCFEVSSSTVSTVLKKWKDTGTCERKKSMTITRKLTNRDVRLLARYISCDRRQTLGQLGSIFGVHRNTIRRYIRSIGYANRIARKKAFLNATHREKRLAFAHRYKHWSVHEWKHVIWTDESSFEVGKYYRQIRVWRKVNEKFFSACLAPTFKSGRTSVMVWGAFSGFFKSPLVILPQGERTSEHFVRTVYEGTLSGLYFMHDIPERITLMEDGAPVHRGKIATSWREAHGIKKFDWPPNSPDLNPIENVWRIVKDKLRHYDRPRSSQEMIQTVTTVWNEVSEDELFRLISSMPDRLKAVIEAKGGNTRW